MLLIGLCKLSGLQSHTPWKERFIDAKQARGDNEDRNHNEDVCIPN